MNSLDEIDCNRITWHFRAIPFYNASELVQQINKWLVGYQASAITAIQGIQFIRVISSIGYSNARSILT